MQTMGAESAGTVWEAPWAQRKRLHNHHDARERKTRISHASGDLPASPTGTQTVELLKRSRANQGT